MYYNKLAQVETPKYIRLNPKLVKNEKELNLLFNKIKSEILKVNNKLSVRMIPWVPFMIAISDSLFRIS